MLQIVPIKLLMLVTGVMWAGDLSKTGVEHSFATAEELIQFSVALEELVKLYCYYALFSSLPCLHQLHLAHRKIWFRIWDRCREQSSSLLTFCTSWIWGRNCYIELKQTAWWSCHFWDVMASVITVGTKWDFTLLCWPHCILLHTQRWQLYVVMCNRKRRIRHWVCTAQVPGPHLFQKRQRKRKHCEAYK